MESVRIELNCRALGWCWENRLLLVLWRPAPPMLELGSRTPVSYCVLFSLFLSPRFLEGQLLKRRLCWVVQRGEKKDSCVGSWGLEDGRAHFQSLGKGQRNGFCFSLLTVFLGRVRVPVCRALDCVCSNVRSLQLCSLSQLRVLSLSEARRQQPTCPSRMVSAQ